tara:strand:- start:44 stop:1900 length:1857 start_codon:yes stop_codon:yes gene_type:complete
MSLERKNSGGPEMFSLAPDGSKVDSHLHGPILDNPEAEAAIMSGYVDRLRKRGYSKEMIADVSAMMAAKKPPNGGGGGGVAGNSVERALRIAKKYSVGGDVEDDPDSSLRQAYSGIGEYYGGVPSDHFSTTPEGKIKVAGVGKLLGLLGGKLTAGETAIEAAIAKARARNADKAGPVREEMFKKQNPSVLIKPGETPNYDALPPVSVNPKNEFHTSGIDEELRAYWDSNPSAAPVAPRLTPEELASKQGEFPYSKRGMNRFEPGQESEPGTILPRRAGPTALEKAVKRHPELGALLDPSDKALYPPRSGVEELHKPAQLYRQSITPSEAVPGGSREILEAKEFTPEYMLRLLDKQRKADRERKTEFIRAMKDKYPEHADSIKRHPEIAEALMDLERAIWQKEAMKGQSAPKPKAKARTRKRSRRDDDDDDVGHARGGRLSSKIDRALSVAKRYASGGPLSDITGLGDPEKHVPHPGGLLNSTVPGRTDKLPISVRPGSYVVPSSVVSALGEDNTLAGAKILDGAMASARTGISRGIMGRNSYKSVKARLRKGRFADGGPTDKIPIIAAGGEYVISPEEVEGIGGGDMDKGHNTLDSFVKRVRKRHIETLRGLAPPKRN